MDEGPKDLDISVIAYDEAAEVPEPRDGAFDLPPFLVPAQRTSVLPAGANAIAFVRRDLLDVSALQPLAQWVAVVRFVRDDPLGVLTRAPGRTITHTYRAQRFFGERDFHGAGRMDGKSQRNTLAVCQYHKLCALAALGFPDAQAPFFAGLNVPSRNASLQSSRSCSFSSVKNARHIFSQTPWSVQRFKRRQQVLGLGYRSGRSCQRAPVRNTHKIPSKHGRLGVHCLPSLFNSGRCGSIFSHCASVKYSVRLMVAPPMSLYRQITYEIL